jgi:hypothetical protein
MEGRGLKGDPKAIVLIPSALGLAHGSFAKEVIRAVPVAGEMQGLGASMIDEATITIFAV